MKVSSTYRCISSSIMRRNRCRRSFVQALAAALAAALAFVGLVRAFQVLLDNRRLLNGPHVDESPPRAELWRPADGPPRPLLNKPRPPQPLQNLPSAYGPFPGQSAQPFLGPDVYTELVDNEHSFYFHAYDKGYPGDRKTWEKWLDQAPWPVTVVMNNNIDKCWPDKGNSFHESLLDNPKLKKLFVTNPSIIHEKVMPLPVGLKWQFHSTKVYGEAKDELIAFYKKVSASPKDTERLFGSDDRTTAIYIRYMTDSNRDNVVTYRKTNPALLTLRSDLCKVLTQVAPETAKCEGKKMIPKEEYFSKMTQAIFVASPAGRGIDTHGTWEALLAGAIPIVPKSVLDAQFKNLPVWLIDSWEEVTDSAVRAKAAEYRAKALRGEYNFEEAFASGWKALISSASSTRS